MRYRVIEVGPSAYLAQVRVLGIWIRLGREYTRLDDAIEKAKRCRAIDEHKRRVVWRSGAKP